MTVVDHVQNKEKMISLSKTLGAPFFCYDIPALRERMTRLKKETVGRGIRLFLAVKANPLSRILTTVAETGFGFDVASVGEMEQVQKNVNEAPLIFTGPAKPRKLLKLALENGVDMFVIESYQQLTDLDELAKEQGRRPEALLRIQLRWEKADDNILGGDAITPFGLPPDEWLKYPTSSLQAVQIRGFHCFQWGNILNVEHLVQIWKEIGHVCKNLATQMNIPFKILDVGGGLGISYEETEVEPEWDSVVDNLASLVEELGLQEIWLELGRYALGPCGRYYCKVVDRKDVYGQELLVLEGGINHLLRPALTGTVFPCTLTRHSSATTKVFQLHGPLCTALDHLGTVSLPDDVKAGDLLQFEQCGAYGFTEAMPYFLCHTLPAEVLTDGDTVEVLRAPQAARSYLC